MTSLAPISLVKDTVGWTRKNLLKNTASTQTINGVTFTVNADKSVTVNGTATASVNSFWLYQGDFQLEEGQDYILSGCPTGGSLDTYNLSISTWTSDGAHANDIGNGVTINGSDYQYSQYPLLRSRIYIANGQTVNNLTFYPMLRRADIFDDTYEPYHESVETMYEEEIHGVNLIKNFAGTTTINGVTFTVNSDDSITLNGTSTDGFAYVLVNRNTDDFRLPDGRYILTGTPTSMGEGKAYMQFQATRDGEIYTFGVESGSGVTGDVLATDTLQFTIRVVSGITFSNVKFYPMLRKAEIEDSTYRPYNDQAIQNQINDKGVLGAKNLLPNTGTSQTINGVTFTVNADGSITAIGTATNGNAAIVLASNVDYGDTTISTYTGVRDTANGYTISDGYVGSHDFCGVTYQANNHNVILAVLDTKSVNGTFYPMLRLASDPDDTYQPYAMTNRELTDGFIPKPLTIDQTTGTNPDDVISNAYYVACGKLCHITLSVKLNSEVDFSTYNSGYVVGKIPMDPKFLQAGSAYVSGHAQVLGAVVEPSSRQDVCLKGDITVVANAVIRINVTCLLA